MFFFEKKNQKTFVCLVPTKAMPTRTEVDRAQAQKFFGSFFQKRTLLLPLALISASPERPACPGTTTSRQRA